jgi:glycosyltransferase involved in cell wall biosynthesis
METDVPRFEWKPGIPGPVRAENRQPTVALLAGIDRFEDFHDKIGVSFETFRDQLTGGWFFNYVDALRTAGVRAMLVFASARVEAPVHFTHKPTGASVWVLPSPLLHRKIRNAQLRLRPASKALTAAASYAATPMRMLVRALRREHCDVILCHEYEYPRFDLCVLLGRLLGLPVFATYQGADETRSWLERPLRSASVRNCAGLIVAAGSEVLRIRHRYGLPRERIAHIPNPMDVVGWQPMDRTLARAELGIPQDAKVVEWHGHVQVWRKGLDVLVDAWNLICSERPDGNLLLLLVGSGPNTSDLRDRVAANHRIMWIDRYVLDRRELWRFLSAADVYTLPSRHEGFAVAPIEAMACGLPVVAADASGVEDLLAGGEDGGGIIVPRGDPAALAVALLRVLDDDGLARELGARGRRRAEQEYSLDVVGRRLRRFLFQEAASPDARSSFGTT